MKKYRLLPIMYNMFLKKSVVKIDFFHYNATLETLVSFMHVDLALTIKKSIKSHQTEVAMLVCMQNEHCAVEKASLGGRFQV